MLTAFLQYFDTRAGQSKGVQPVLVWWLSNWSFACHSLDWHHFHVCLLPQQSPECFDIRLTAGSCHGHWTDVMSHVTSYTLQG